MDYRLPSAIRVEADGPVRIVRLSRPDQLNAVNDELHGALAQVFPQLSADRDARVAVDHGGGARVLGRRRLRLS
jgi:enoyl-CoA hydratase/carnithine racemase